MTGVSHIDVEAAFATPDEQTVIPLRVPAGTTALGVLHRSGLLQGSVSIAAVGLLVGVFGRRVDPDHVVVAGDRVELYRPLSASPKQARRIRAARKPQT